MSLRTLLSLFTFCCALCAGQSLFARGIAQEDVLRAEILAGWQTPQGQMAGLALQLAPGWKTYWRSPGEGGIPPQFDWSGSQNVAAINVLWPAPEVFRSNGLRTLGYRDQVVLPLEIVAKDPARPVSLHLEMELGICKEVCLPAFVTLAAPLAGEGPAGAAPIKAALRARPATSAAKILCKIEPIADGLRLTTSVKLPPLGREETMAIEPADGRIWVSETESRRSGDRFETTAELVAPSGAPFALERSSLTFTVISKGRSIEISGCSAP